MAFGKMATIAGAAIVAAALAWWWTTFGDVILYGYLSWPEAGRCMGRDSDLCALAKALCAGSHPRALPAYSTAPFWLGFGLMSLGLLTAGPFRRAAI